MNIAEYLNNAREIHENILGFIEDEENSCDNLQNLQTIFNNQKIQDNKHKLTLLLHLIAKIADNHYQLPLFFEKLEKLLLIFKDSIKTHYSNYEIFNIFKSNKKILLFLIEEKMMVINSNIAKMITTGKYNKQNYPQYFSPEIKQYKNEKWFPKNGINGLNLELQIPDNFNEIRKDGQNEKYICKLIQKDLIKEFIIYINQCNYSLDSFIIKSIYETNSFLIRKQEITLIEYAAFYGSIKIFQYLTNNNAKLTQSVWIYSIHGNNPEIIQFLEDHFGDLGIEFYKLCFIESIKCHHINLAHYFKNNYLQNEETLCDAFIKGIKYYNFCFIPNDLINEYSFSDFCKYDYFEIAHFLLHSNLLIDVNKKEEIIKYYFYDEKTRNDCIMYDYTLLDGGQIKYEKTALFLAVEKGNIEIVKLLLSNDKLDINTLNSLRALSVTHEGYFKTALYLAVEKENIEIIKLLLTNDKLNINILNEYSDMRTYEKTALYLAVEKENIEIIKLLLTKNDFDINTINGYKQGTKSSRDGVKIKHTVLHLAIEKENIAIIKLLLTNNGIDVNAICINSKNIFGISNGISCKMSKIKSKKTPLYLAVEMQNNDIIKLILANDKVDVNIINEVSSVDEGVITGSINYSTYKQTALHLAVESCNINVIKYLLSNKKIDLNIYKDGSYKTEYILNERIDHYSVLLKIATGSANFTIDEIYNEKYSKTAFFIAVENENIDIIKLLLTNNELDINILNKYSLLSEKILFNIKYGNEKYEKAALYMAVEKGNIEIIKLLLTNANININVLNCESCNAKRTPLHCAVDKGNIKIITFLLQLKGIDLNIRDEQGKTPIEYSNKSEITKLFNH